MLLVCFAAVAQKNPMNLKTQDTINSITKTDLLTDMDEYGRSMAKLHVNPFTYIKKNEFFDEIERIKNNAAQYDADEILIQLKQLNAKIQDEHVNIFYRPRDIFPFQSYWFGEGIYITRIEEENMKYLYSKIVAINNIPVQEVIEKISTLLPDKNTSYIMAHVPDYLNEPFVMHGLQISRARNLVTYTLVSLKNDTMQWQPALTDRRKSRLLKGFDRYSYLRYSGSGKYWYKYIDSENYIYFKYSSCQNDKEHPFKNLEDKLMEDIDDKKPKKIIIDLRDNGGGYPKILNHFIDNLARTNLNKKGKIYVLTGRYTFSAAVINTSYFKEKTYAIIVGEETGGSTAFFGGVEYFCLPATKLNVDYCTNYWATNEKYDGPLKPDVVINEQFSDYSKGIDAALEYAIKN